MSALAVGELELPVLDTLGMERPEALAATLEVSRRHWLARTPFGFMIVRYEDAVAVLRDRRFHSALSTLRDTQTMAPDRDGHQRSQSILTMEGDQHARLRRLVAPAFTTGSTDRLRPFMREVMTSLVDAVAEDGACDVVSAICEPYPIPVICELLGAPQSDCKMFSDWATHIFKVFNQNLAEDLPAIEQASAELDRYVRTLVEFRRNLPGDDLLSHLIAIEESGDRLSTEELVMLAEAILMAGTDTTRNQLACCVALFAEHPVQWDELGDNPHLAPRLVEESMRYLGAVRGTTRFASEDVEYRRVLFPKGTFLSVSLAAANRDPSVWDEADSFEVVRERGAQQITFGSGIHHCMGAALARAELQEALVILSKRMPGLHTDGPVEWKPATFGIWGPSRLPVRFDP